MNPMNYAQISANPVMAQAKQLLFYGENVPGYRDAVEAGQEGRQSMIEAELEKMKSEVSSEKERLLNQAYHKSELQAAADSLNLKREVIQDQMEAVKSDTTAAQDLLAALGTMQKTSALSYRAMLGV